jgi:hypothetical protein
MSRLRLLGACLFLYGVTMLVLLATPARNWALDHSIAEIVSYTDRRVASEIHGSVDLPVAVAGSVVTMFAGVWFAVVIPRMFRRPATRSTSSMSAGVSPR